MFVTLVTGHVLRCDVFVNRINRIDITTTTRELLLGQSPELLDVQAYDDTGTVCTVYHDNNYSYV